MAEREIVDKLDEQLSKYDGCAMTEYLQASYLSQIVLLRASRIGVSG